MPTPKEPSLMDEISSAIEDATPDGVVTDDADDSLDLEADPALDEGDGTGDSEGDGEDEGEGEDEGDESLDDDGGEPPAGYERDPATGRFVKKVEEKVVEPKPGEKPGEKPAEKPGAKKPDALNDPIPKDLKTETKQRIRTLIDTTKEAVATRDQAVTDFNFMVQGVQATGASPEQYGETLSWLALFNSPDPSQKKKAYELVESVADRMATMMGIDRQVGDPLAAHADLKDAVAKGQVTAQYAKEIARNRNQAKFTGDISESQRQQQQQQDQHEQSLTQARSDLGQLEATLSATDPNWARHKEILVAALKPVFGSIPPNQWRDKFQAAYRELLSKRVVGNVRPRVPANQPMRPGRGSGSGAGQQRSKSGSALDAVNNALENMPR